MSYKKQDRFAPIYYNDALQLHREDGPAVQSASGHKYWYLNGVNYSEQEYKKEMRSRKLNKILSKS